MDLAKFFVVFVLISAMSAVAVWLNMTAMNIIRKNGGRAVIVFIIVASAAIMALEATAIYFTLDHFYGIPI